MKVELHCHTKRFSPCAKHTAEELLSAMIERGYGAVYLTEHQVVWPTEDLAVLQARFPAIRIFSGVEIYFTREGYEHLVVLGPDAKDYLAMTADPAALLEHARRHNHLTFFAHPFRSDSAHRLLDLGLRSDAIEWVSRSQRQEKASAALRWAEDNHVPLVNAGDTHSIGDLDRQWIETHRDITDAQDIRAIVLEGAYNLMPKQ